jgi:tetratricopeptide (TPR) repeat protein
MTTQVPDHISSTADPCEVTDKKRLQAVVAEAFALLGTGEPQKALAHIGPVADLATRSDVGAYVFGLIYFNANDPRTALSWFERAIALNGSHVDALAARAIVLQRLGQPSEALESYRAILELRPNDADTMFSIGVTLQGLGQIAEALSAYEDVLRADPDHVEALTHRGVLLERYQRLEDALACFTAIELLRPDDSCNLVYKASVLQRLGRHEAALAVYEAAARRCPQDTDMEISRGNLLVSLGRFEDAIACCDRALLQGPAQPQIPFIKGVALQGLGQAEAALAAYDAALALDPGSCEAWCNRGNALHELGRLAEALASYDGALEVRPNFVPALINRATVLLRCGRYLDAVSSCDDLLRIDPGHAGACGVRGAALHLLGRLDAALEALERATAHDPSIAEAWLNRGNVLQELDRREDAVASYEQALRVRPDYPEALSGLGVALKELGHVDAALVRFDEALRLRPSYADARNNRAGALLVSGMFQAGFDDFESRWDRSKAPPKTVVSDLPVWDGGDLKGKPILVWDEQGLGDLIQFSRYLPGLVERGADVTLLCRKNMHRLLRGLSSRIRLVDSIEPTPAYAMQCALMSLPRAFQTTLDTVPARSPYLFAEPDLVARWTERIGGEGFRIGICWRGNVAQNRQRSIPLECFAPLAAIAGVRLISLQKLPDCRDAEVTERLDAVERLGEGFDASPDSFIDCAAVMASLDLVVTADTSIAHLAGALGRPVLVALKHAADWRWLQDRDDSPWYPTMRLCRQARKGDWTGVLDRIAAWVEPLAAARTVTHQASPPAAAVSIPVSVGELIDKMTILEMEESRTTDPCKRANARRELARLQMIRLEIGLGNAKLRTLETELKDVNVRLWQLQDSLRKRDALGAPDTELADLARQACKAYGTREGLKQGIDFLVRCMVSETKSYPASDPSPRL